MAKQLDDGSISPIFENAIDSLRIGMEFFQRQGSYSTLKHSILTVFHAIELLLKERLHRTNPILIYKNIDREITDESLAVGLTDAICRLENIGVKLPDEQRTIVAKMQKRRNRIEHHRYDYRKGEDAIIIAEALKVVFYFTELVLDVRLEDHIDQGLVRSMRERVLDYDEFQALAEYRFEEWAKNRWPNWDEKEGDLPDGFEGMHDCPECGQSWLEMGCYHPIPFCFWCNLPIDAANCEHCGRTYRVGIGCDCKR